MTRKKKINKLYNKIKKSLKKECEYDVTMSEIKSLEIKLEELDSKYKSILANKNLLSMDDLIISSLRDSIEYEKDGKVDKFCHLKLKEATDILNEYKQLKIKKEKLLELSKSQFLDKIKLQIEGFDKYLKVD
jgi:hypothetical protein